MLAQRVFCSISRTLSSQLLALSTVACFRRAPVELDDHASARATPQVFG